MNAKPPCRGSPEFRREDQLPGSNRQRAEECGCRKEHKPAGGDSDAVGNGSRPSCAVGAPIRAEGRRRPEGNCGSPESRAPGRRRISSRKPGTRRCGRNPSKARPTAISLASPPPSMFIREQRESGDENSRSQLPRECRMSLSGIRSAPPPQRNRRQRQRNPIWNFHREEIIRGGKRHRDRKRHQDEISQHRLYSVAKSLHRKGVSNLDHQGKCIANALPLPALGRTTCIGSVPGRLEAGHDAIKILLQRASDQRQARNDRQGDDRRDQGVFDGRRTFVVSRERHEARSSSSEVSQKACRKETRPEIALQTCSWTSVPRCDDRDT